MSRPGLAPLRFQPPGGVETTWLIARRAALESLQDRFSLLAGLFFAFVMPLGLLALVVGSLDGPNAPGPAVSGYLTTYLLVVGVLPAFSSVGIAAGLFAGEKERGVLTPLLASPASNLAIFAGKVLGAVIPPLIYATLAEGVFLLGVAVLLGPASVGLLAPTTIIATVLLVPAATCFAAVVASLISSRVRTFNAAQQLTALVLMPLWGLVFGLAANVQTWSPLAVFGAIAGLLALDAGLTVLAAATWRREDVLAQR